LNSDANPTIHILLASSADAREHNRMLKLYHTYTAAGYKVTFVGMDRLKKRNGRDLIDGLECTYIVKGYGHSNWRLLIGYPVWMVRLFFYLLFRKPDLVHVFELDGGLPTSLALMGRSIPFVYDVQDNYELRKRWPFPIKYMIRWADRWVLRRAGGIIMPDEKRIVGVFADARDKITIIPNCPPDAAAASAPRVKHPGGRLTVLAMGQLHENRGIELLLDVAGKMPQIRLLMAGNFPDPRLEQKARNTPNVEFRGWVPWEEAIALGREADIVFAFYDPAYKVNLLANAQKWFDAMMTGTPILSNREIANANWIQEIGYLCTYGDREELAQTLEWISQHPEEAEAKGKCGRALYEQQYNWPLMEQRLLKMVRHLTPGRELSGSFEHPEPSRKTEVREGRTI
jgi:glycosyltransferase involved in cell wall biosynthesis